MKVHSPPKACHLDPVSQKIKILEHVKCKESRRKFGLFCISGGNTDFYVGIYRREQIAYMMEYLYLGCTQLFSITQHAYRLVFTSG